MVQLNQLSNFRPGFFIQARIKELPLDTLKKFRAPLLLLCTLALGFCAHEQSQLSAVDRWHRTHPIPRPFLFRNIEAIGFKKVTSERALQWLIKKARFVPSESGDPPPTLLMSTAQDWIFFPREEPPLAFSLPHAPLPNTHLILPPTLSPTPSWENFALWLSELEKGVKKPLSLNPSSDPRAHRDPREIYF